MAKPVTPLALLLSLAASMSSSQIPLGQEFQVNSYTTGAQDYPVVASDASGDFVVVWVGPYGSSTRVSAQQYDASGAAVGGEFRVDDTQIGSYQSFQTVASDPNGNFVVAWTDFNRDGSSAGVFGQRFDPTGTRQGATFQVNSYTTGAQGRPSVALDGTGRFVVVWESYDGSGRGVFGQRYDGSGVPQGGEFKVNTYTTSHQWFAAVASDPSGNFVVVWEGFYYGDQDGHRSGVFAQRFDASGAPQGGEFQVNIYTTGDQFRADVASDPSGNFVVVWCGNGTDSNGYDVFARRYDASGNAQGGEFRVNSYTTDFQEVASVAADPSGDFVVVWKGYGPQDGNGWGVFGQRYHSSGVRLGAEFTVNSYTTGYQWMPSVASSASGTFVVAWTSVGQDGSSSGIFGQRFDAISDVIFADGFE